MASLGAARFVGFPSGYLSVRVRERDKRRDDERRGKRVRLLGMLLRREMLLWMWVSELQPSLRYLTEFRAFSLTPVFRTLSSDLP